MNVSAEVEIKKTQDKIAVEGKATKKRRGQRVVFTNLTGSLSQWSVDFYTTGKTGIPEFNRSLAIESIHTCRELMRLGFASFLSMNKNLTAEAVVDILSTDGAFPPTRQKRQIPLTNRDLMLEALVSTGVAANIEEARTIVTSGVKSEEVKKCKLPNVQKAYGELICKRAEAL